MLPECPRCPGVFREQARSYKLVFILSGPKCNLALGIQQMIALAVAGEGSFLGGCEIAHGTDDGQWAFVAVFQLIANPTDFADA
ncbi:hypothetical protein [Pseudomonas sp. BIC9C]|uniref:hypothetical protein n=1 Tax=Pseudomonas sp. BIC9C TaxID=3078458 RepID=UPI002AD45CDD|nr:hypothetical protein [Pseudomonas sp. BIC9C]